MLQLCHQCIDLAQALRDRFGEQLAADFYGRLTKDGRHPPDLDGSATALHHAVRALRAKYPRTPTLWAAHTHTGV